MMQMNNTILNLFKNETILQFENHTEDVLYIPHIILLFICFLAISENLGVCLIIYHNQRLHTPTNYFIVSLCITNILFTGVLVPMHVLAGTNPIYLFLNIIIILMYICNLTAITFERYISITYPLRYYQIITEKRTIRIIIICYILPTLYCLIPLAWKAKQTLIIHKVYMTITLVVFLIIPLIFILGVYGKVYHATHTFFARHRKHIVIDTSKENCDSDSEENDLDSFNYIWQELKFICCLHKSKFKEYKYLEISYIVSPSQFVIQPRISLEMNQNKSKHKSKKSNPTCSYKKTNLLSIEGTENGEGKCDDNYEESDTLLCDSASIAVQRSMLKQSKSLDEQKLTSKITAIRNKLRERNELKRIGSEPTHGSRSFSSNSFHSTNTRCSSTRSSGNRTSFRSLQSFQIRTKHMLKELKASMAFAMVALTYMFTWLPVVYMTSLAVLDETIPIELSVFSIYMIGLSGAIDPLLYALLLKDFRLTIRKLIRVRRQKK